MKDANETIYIYALIDPRDNLVRYVGQSKDPQKRYRAHTGGWENVPKRLWLRDLSSNGLRPVIKVIESVSDGSHRTREAFWIKHYLDLGHDLVNLNRAMTGYTNVKNPKHARPGYGHAIDYNISMGYNAPLVDEDK